MINSFEALWIPLASLFSSALRVTQEPQSQRCGAERWDLVVSAAQRGAVVEEELNHGEALPHVL